MEPSMDKKREKSDVTADFSARVSDDLKRFVAVAAGQRAWSDSIESMLWRAAQRLGISQRRAKAFWYREAGGIGADEYLMVRERAQELLERQTAHAALQAEIAELDRQERARGQRVGTGPNARPDESLE
jgi:hypothetical protein